MIIDGPCVARLGAGLPERPRAEGGWHQGPRIVFSAPPPWELNPAALSAVSEPGSLNHPWSPRSFQGSCLPAPPSPPDPALPTYGCTPPPLGLLAWAWELGAQTAWLLPGHSRPPPVLAPGGLSVSLSLPFTLWLPPRLEKVPGSLRTEARGGTFLESYVTENIFALASAPDEAIVQVCSDLKGTCLGFSPS